ncbi:acyltransferase family protein [Methylocystis sp. IM3]|uniref:acyltransferase family protein n=1 Tax=Methylocystis sp. IM3 TaxID=3136722 RepID=UPI00311A6840
MLKDNCSSEGKNHSISKKSDFRPEIEGLRALAVIAVILNHFDKGFLPSGYLGVDIFFVISGFVITASLSRSREAGLADFLKLFYVRRMKRLLPGLLLCVAISSVLASLLLSDPQLSLRTAVFSVFGFSNLYLLRQATDYFAPSAETNVFLHTWSLSVEEQFYFLFPLLFWLGNTYIKGRGTALAVAALSVISLGAFIRFYTVYQPAAYFLMPTRWWELGIGCLSFLALEKFRDAFRHIEFLRNRSFFVLILLISSLWLPVSAAVIATLIAVASTAILIANIRVQDTSYKILSHPIPQFIGAISYSLYLWHWVVISLGRWTTGVNAWTAPWQFAVIFLLALGSYWLVENPARHSKWPQSRSRTIAYGFAASASVAILILCLAFPLKRPLAEIAHRVNPPAYAGLEIMQRSLPCHTPQRVETAIQDCLLPEKSSSNNIYVIGDSHSSNHVASIQEAVQDRTEIGVRYLVEYGFINDLEGKKCATACLENSMQAHIDFFSHYLRSGDVVVFSWSRDRVDQGDKMPRRPNSHVIDRLKGKIDVLKSLVLAHHATLILVDDIPKPCGPAIYFETEIAQRGNLKACQVQVETSKSDRAGLTELYKSLVEPGVVYLDPHDELCERGACSLTLQGGNLIYGDTSPHFLRSNSAILKSFWKSTLVSMLSGPVKVEQSQTAASPIAPTEANEGQKR